MYFLEATHSRFEFARHPLSSTAFPKATTECGSMENREDCLDGLQSATRCLGLLGAESLAFTRMFFH
jgi:hypothetical protein